MFQTDPCGIEAQRGSRETHWLTAFQTDPCGIEAGDGTDTNMTDNDGFRRTLVGLKLDYT